VCSRDAGGGEIDASIDGQLDRIVGALLPGGATHAADAPAPGGAA
jgi:flagellar biosynthesis/type III secretory pathway protein FliH